MEYQCDVYGINEGCKASYNVLYLIERRRVDDVRFPEMKKQVELICKYFLEGGKNYGNGL